MFKIKNIYMAKLTLNNKENIKNLICFNHCPNIIGVESSATTEARESVTYDVGSLSAVSGDVISRIIVNGYAITSTDDMTKVSGRRFSRNGGTYCCLSIVNALKNIPQLVMNYDIKFHQGNTFSITAKNAGSRYSLDIEFENLNGYSLTTSTIGTSNDVLYGSNYSRVYCDIYYIDNTYLTTLQKEYYKNGVSFNVSPALQSISNNDDIVKWSAKLYAMVDNDVKDLGEISDNYIINGYLVNQGGTYIDMNGVTGGTIPALNVDRGIERTQYNNSIIYIYDNIFPISLYKNGKTSESVEISYLESDEVVVTSSTQTITLTTDKEIDTYNIELDEDLMRDSYYIDLEFSFGYIRLNVINPPYSNVECNRVYWYNSYGGVSYFDFLGDKVDERKSEVTTYNKSLLDFYKNDKQEQAVVYYRDNDMTVSLTSHLIEKDGLYQLYDLQNSYKSWITINGVPYYIIIDSLTISEPSTDVYTATIKYKYSLLDSFA